MQKTEERQQRDSVQPHDQQKLQLRYLAAHTFPTKSKLLVPRS